ncbi:penicillin-insensitive murein endopeptidase [Roseospira marina]|uniref:Penicillin-insensitive murein endopeptidase n=1 Tax=Roseospira marina TaxID=140057 RepID=A0A5M6II03_9PROT|nr:penicillin-insensitive murein endopeptidase [Roseospira marina]KAA5607459.1 penicillin-insensitive murein endopeptidase [Roseospira marina]MBB4312361.1 penicillin-insensitive murein endopeptidase [Roseospira marina]MBB5085623.1 penicillin-insensitive murein endopeptidase [Roseospira marina]
MRWSTIRRAMALGVVLLGVAFLWLGGLTSARAQQDDWSRQTTPAPGPARAIGTYTEGCLSGAVALPLHGAGYTVLRPQRLRYFGHPHLIAVVRDLAAWADANGWGTLLVGDLSQPRGGPMSFGHASHEIGLDADIWLRLLPPGQRLSPEDRDDPTPVSMVRPGAGTADPTRWTATHSALVRAAAQDPRVARIFVNPAIKATLCDAFPADEPEDAAWLRKVRPWYGHDSHMHLRLSCPTDSPSCREQDPVPPGTGCDPPTFAWWAEQIAARQAAQADTTPPPARPPVARPPQSVPPDCSAVLSAR